MYAKSGGVEMSVKDINRKVYIKEYSCYTKFFDGLLKKYNMKRKHSQSLWYIINLLIIAKETQIDKNTIYTGYKTLSSYVNFYSKRKMVNRAQLMGFMLKLKKDGLISYERGGYHWVALKNNNYKKVNRFGKITFEKYFIDSLKTNEELERLK